MFWLRGVFVGGSHGPLFVDLGVMAEAAGCLLGVARCLLVFGVMAVAAEFWLRGIVSRGLLAIMAVECWRWAPPCIVGCPRA